MEASSLRIRLEDIRSAKRNRGSPVLVVHHVQEGRKVGHAFFFAKPPPLKRGRGKRKQARKSFFYLQSENRAL